MCYPRKVNILLPYFFPNFVQVGVSVDWADALGGGGQTALHLAAIAGHVDAVRCLIDLGASVNKVNDISSATPLHLAGK